MSIKTNHRTRAAVVVVALIAASCAGCDEDVETPDLYDAGSTTTLPDGSDPMDADATPTSQPQPEPDDPDVPPAPVVLVQLGEDVPIAVRDRVRIHLRSAARRDVVFHANPLGDLPAGSLVLGFGDVPATDLVLGTDRQAPGPEGFRLKSGVVGEASMLVVDGTSEPGDDGVRFGVYALLEHLGFAFLHPLEPTIPGWLPDVAPEVDLATAPRWWFRGIQIHTMHPLELTDLLNGWGPAGPDDAAGWSSMLGEWDAFLEWMLANGQNQVHWYLLSGGSLADFPGSSKHIDRLRTVVRRAHDFGVLAGADVPIRQHQQNSWRMIEEDGTLDEEVRQIHERVDLLMEAEFDFVASASGTSEFTAPDDERMLAWMNALTERMAEHGKPAYLKVHASTGQTTPNYVDRVTGEPLNFNFLPTYADPRLGIMPHTVQHYALDDPAPTYGNSDFGYMREFLQEEVGRRPTIWHPETSYWVSFDIDVPLFLPVYALTRARDLRLLAGDEDAGAMGRGPHAGGSMDGQSTFSSGWEWGYWLGEVVTARAAWDPHTEAATDAQAVVALLAPLERVLGDAGAPVLALIREFAVAQHDLLISGIVDGRPPTQIARRNGQAYLQGFETWDDVAHLGATMSLMDARTQPERLGFHELRLGTGDREYEQHVAPLLAEMSARFGDLHARLQALRPSVPDHALSLYDDIVDSAHMTALRAQQVDALYEYVYLSERGDIDAAQQRLEDAQLVLDTARSVVARRERAYRVPPDRIAGWRENPTAYEFTYLWTARSLHYWWRDEALAVLAPLNPCYLNIIDPLTVAFGEGMWPQLGNVVADIFTWTPYLGSAAECLRAPALEPTYPPSGLR